MQPRPMAETSKLLLPSFRARIADPLFELSKVYAGNENGRYDDSRRCLNNPPDVLLPDLTAEFFEGKSERDEDWGAGESEFGRKLGRNTGVPPVLAMRLNDKMPASEAIDKNYVACTAETAVLRRNPSRVDVAHVTLNRTPTQRAKFIRRSSRDANRN